jgi:methyl-accepting chemotaxis protein
MATRRLSLRSLRIVPRLVLGFGLVLALTLLMAVNGLARMGEMNAQLQRIITEDGRKIRLVEAIRDATRLRAEAVRNIVILEDEEARARERERFDASVKAFSGSVEELEAIADRPQEQALVEAIKSTARETYPVIAEVIRFAADGFPEEAGTTLVEQAGPQQQVLLGHLTDMVELEKASMDAHQEAALEALGWARNVSIALTAAAVLLSLLVAFAVARSITVPIRRAVSAADQVAGGDLSGRIEVDGRDEMARLFQSLAVMKASLATRGQEVRKAAAEAQRLATALDSVSTHVLLADREHRVVYLNPALRRLWGEHEGALRADLPSFSVDGLVGSALRLTDLLPGVDPRRLADLDATLRARVVLGGRDLEATVNPVRDAAGERVGSVVEWLDRSEVLKAQAEVDAIVGAALAGDLSGRIDEAGKEGFLKALSGGINRLLEIMDGAVRATLEALDRTSQGDLTQRLENDHQGLFGAMRDNVNATVERLRELIGRIKGATASINVAAGEIAQGNGDLAARTEQQASALEETASSMEELTASVKHNAESAAQANELAKEARGVAVKGGEVVDQVVRTMSAINESSAKVVDIISVIDAIAFQTNILALNAAVEAARAGEQGRGFSVVAGEVRQLASRSAAAAKEIKALIDDSVARAEAGSRLVEEAGRTMEAIVAAVKQVTDIMGDISTATAEQSTGIEQVGRAVVQMDEGTQQNAALVEQATAAAASLEDQASALDRLVQVFKVAEGQQAVAAAPARAAAVRRPAPPAEPSDDDWQEF